MAYSEHWLLQFGGTLGSNQNEIWSCGIRMEAQNTVPAGDVEADDYLNGTAKDALEDWFGKSYAAISNQTQLRFMKFNKINEQGLYADESVTHAYYWATPVQGTGGGSSALPYQCAVVLTWETDAATRGPGSRGRIYSPHPTLPVIAATGLWDAGSIGGVAEAAGELLNSLDDSLGLFGQLRPVIASKVNGALNQIDRVTVDTRPDILRSRGNALVSTRYVKDVNY